MEFEGHLIVQFIGFNKKTVHTEIVRNGNWGDKGDHFYDLGVLKCKYQVISNLL